MSSTDHLFLLAEAEGEWELGGRGAVEAVAGPALKWILNPSMFVSLGAVFGLAGSGDPIRAVFQLQRRL